MNEKHTNLLGRKYFLLTTGSLLINSYFQGTSACMEILPMFSISLFNYSLCMNTEIFPLMWTLWPKFHCNMYLSLSINIFDWTMIWCKYINSQLGQTCVILLSKTNKHKNFTVSLIGPIYDITPFSTNQMSVLTGVRPVLLKGLVAARLYPRLKLK